MIVNNTYKQNSIQFGASEKKTAKLVEKWIQKKRPDKLVLMLTRDDFPSTTKRGWADFKAYWMNKESSQTCYFTEFIKKFKYLGIGQCLIQTPTPIVRPELFRKALNATIHLINPNSGAKEAHKAAAKDLYIKHSTQLEYRVSRNIPLLDWAFQTSKTK